MPRGVYIRTKSKTKKQIEWMRELGKRPKTQKQRDSACKTIKIASEVARKLPRSAAQIENMRKVGKDFSLCAETIVEHHNDLCHGAKDPDNVNYITNSEHARFHANLRVQNGTHPWLAHNREA